MICRLAVLLLAGASATALAAPASAQDEGGTQENPVGAAEAEAEDQGVALNQIVVTANRRAELAQDVPLAVSAFDTELLERSRLDSASNLALKVPNLNYSQQLYGTSNFSIRGIGYTLVTTAGDQGVGIAENYAPIDRARITDAEFYDVERVEVLRGPQGTLYGRNATGGVINIITNKPQLGDTSGSVTAEYGNFDLVRLRGFVNLSPDENIGLRAAGFMLKRDGTAENTYTGNDIDSRDLWSTRLSLRAQVTPDITVDAMWEHFEADDSRYGARQACLNDPGPASVGGVPTTNLQARNYLSEGCQQVSIYAPGVLQQNNNSNTILSGLLASLVGVTTGDVFAGNVQPDSLRDQSLTMDPFNRVNNDNAQLSIEWQASDELTFSSITNYNKDRTIQGAGLVSNNGSFNNTPLTPGGVFVDPQLGPQTTLMTQNYNVLKQEQISQEFRLQSDFGGVFDFNLGAFYYEAKRHNDIYFFANGQSIYARVAAPTAYVDPHYPPNDDGHTYYLSHTTYKLESLAGFGEAYIRPTDKLQFTLGVRYTEDTKTQPIVPLPLFTPGRGLTETGIQEVKFGEWTGRAVAEYNITDDNMVYGGYSRGYKGGGFNPSSLNDPNSSFEPETVDAFEIGSKNSFFGRRLIFNATGFYYKYNDYQYTVNKELSTETRNVNTTLWGLELESAFYPTDNFQIDVSGGYLKTKVNDGPNNLSINPWNVTGGDPNLVPLQNTSGAACVGNVSGVATALALINAGAIPAAALLSACPTAAAPNGQFANTLGLVTSFGTPVDITGNKLPNSPEWTVSAGAQYTFELGSDWTLTPRADYHYQSGVEGSIYNDPENRANGWHNVNATLSLVNDSQGLRVQGWVKNLFDSDAITAVGVNSASLGLTRRLYLLEPRTFGISVSKDF